MNIIDMTIKLSGKIQKKMKENKNEKQIFLK